MLARCVGIETKKLRDAIDLKHVREHYSLLVEATDSSRGLELAQQMTEPRGTLVLKPTFHGAAPVETWPIVVKEINVVGSRCGVREGNCAAALGKGASAATRYAYVSPGRGARSDALCAAAWHDEGPAE